MRTLGDIPTGGNSWPPSGKHLCRCAKADWWKSPNKQTPAVMLTWTTHDAMYQFEDPLFVTGKAIGRLAIVAKRICGMSTDSILPNDDLDTAKELAKYIKENIEAMDALVTVVETKEQYVVREGPEIGQSKDVIRHRVAFDGYDVPEGQETGSAKKAESDIPF